MKLAPRPTKSTANVLTAPFDPRIDHPVEVWDMTLREGEQPPGVVFTADEKLEIARMLGEIGVHYVALGFPAASPAEREAVTRIARAGLGFQTAALCRMLPDDIDLTIDTGVDVIGLFIGTSDIHLFEKLGWTEARALDAVEKAVRRCKDRGVKVLVAAEDGSRTPLPRLVAIGQRAAEAGADFFDLADTVGVFTPASAYRVTQILTALVPCPIVVHFHDDLGLALANTLAAVEAGARVVQCTVNGAGERCGNVCLEELAVVLSLKYGVDLGVKLERLTELCGVVHRASGTEPPEHKAITGKWAFTHESGIHVAGVLGNPETYQTFPPERIGRSHEIVFGKHSGAQGIFELAKRANIELAEPQARVVLERVKTQAERKNVRMTDELVLSFIREATS